MLLDSQIEAWLAEDVGHRDVTDDVPGTTTGRLVAKADGVFAGMDAAEAVFDYLDCALLERTRDGEPVSAGDVLFRVEGPATDVLRAERPATNVTMHASGIATRTQRAVRAARETSDSVAIAGTRKTTPGLRGIEKRAVEAGGGDTHRLDLSHMVLIKENHIAELGLEQAIERFDERSSFATKLEVEVETPAMATRAVAAGADIVLLDNMTPAETREAVALVDGDTLTEASGEIGLETIAAYADTGVDIVSMGGLTYGASWLDCSFRTG
jgi:nicotinate-nucleotide pyrophosphorylase (carboxylating)